MPGVSERYGVRAAVAKTQVARASKTAATQADAVLRTIVRRSPAKWSGVQALENSPIARPVRAALRKDARVSTQNGIASRES